MVKRILGKDEIEGSILSIGFRGSNLLLNKPTVATVAQRIERRFCKPEVVGLNPTVAFAVQVK